MLRWSINFMHGLLLLDSPFSCGNEILDREKRRRERVPDLTTLTAQGAGCMSSREKNHHSMKRKAKRFRTNGIVALTNLAKPVLSNIYDIGAGGVSFLHVDEMAVDKVEFTMDILIYDSLTGFEYFISQVNGRVVWRELVSDPENNFPVWRFNVAFFDLDSSQQSKLHILCNQQRTANVWFLDKRLPKISYDG
jgi:hypothetical protein